MHSLCFHNDALDKKTSNCITKAVLPCVGHSSRFGSYLGTLKTKFLLPLSGRPLIHCVLDELIALKISEVLFVVAEQAHELQQYLGNGSAFGLNINYLVHANHNGPGGALVAAEGWIKGSSFVTVLPDMINLISETACKCVNLKKSFFQLACEQVMTKAAEVAYCCQHTSLRQKKEPIRTLGRWVFQPQFIDILRRTVPDCGGEIRIPDAVHLAESKGLIVSRCFVHHSTKSININTREDYLEAKTLMAKGYTSTLI